MTSESKGRARGGLSTRAVHAGEAEPRPGESVVTPVAQTSTFYSEPVPEGEVLYTRYGTNPNHLVVQGKLAALEGAEAALVLASGMAAESMAILAFAGAAPSRSHIVAQAELYGGTLTLFKHDLPALGIETTFVDSDDACSTPSSRSTPQCASRTFRASPG